MKLFATKIPRLAASYSGVPRQSHVISKIKIDVRGLLCLHVLTQQKNITKFNRGPSDKDILVGKKAPPDMELTSKSTNFSYSY